MLTPYNSLSYYIIKDKVTLLLFVISLSLSLSLDINIIGVS